MINAIKSCPKILLTTIIFIPLHKCFTNSFLLNRWGILHRNTHYHSHNVASRHYSTTQGSTSNNQNNIISILARRQKTYERLVPLINLTNHAYHNSSTSISDIGCDHGLLALSLALSSSSSSQRYQKVIGIDVSQRALDDGALKNYERVKRLISKDDNISSLLLSPLEFRPGDGLAGLHNDEVDSICLAGMGVNTMIQIVTTEEMDRVGCRNLFVQPTNSRPRNMIRLYDYLNDLGWQMEDESIKKISNRWYISSFWMRQRRRDGGCDTAALKSSINFPGERLLDDDAYREYVRHHRKWLENDSHRYDDLAEEDVRWLNSNVSNI